MTDQAGPDPEQLDTPEDVERLSDIGDLIRTGAAKVEDFELGRYEMAFVQGYIRGDGGSDQL